MLKFAWFQEKANGNADTHFNLKSNSYDLWLYKCDLPQPLSSASCKTWQFPFLQF